MNFSLAHYFKLNWAMIIVISDIHAAIKLVLIWFHAIYLSQIFQDSLTLRKKGSQ